MADGPHWADIASAIGTCSTGLAAAILSWKAYRIEQTRIQHELFSSRKEIRDKFENISANLIGILHFRHLKEKQIEDTNYAAKLKECQYARYLSYHDEFDFNFEKEEISIENVLDQISPKIMILFGQRINDEVTYFVTTLLYYKDVRSMTENNLIITLSRFDDNRTNIILMMGRTITSIGEPKYIFIRKSAYFHYKIIQLKLDLYMQRLKNTIYTIHLNYLKRKKHTE